MTRLFIKYAHIVSLAAILVNCGDAKSEPPSSGHDDLKEVMEFGPYSTFDYLFDDGASHFGFHDENAYYSDFESKDNKYLYLYWKDTLSEMIEIESFDAEKMTFSVFITSTSRSPIKGLIKGMLIRHQTPTDHG